GARIYQRLLPRLCTYDQSVRDYRGKKKGLGRRAGQMASLIYALLKTDQETLSQVPPGASPPPAMLSDPEIHRKHQEGSYRSLKPNTLPRKILQLPSKSSCPQEDPPRFLPPGARKRGGKPQAFWELEAGVERGEPLEMQATTQIQAV